MARLGIALGLLLERAAAETRATATATAGVVRRPADAVEPPFLAGLPPDACAVAAHDRPPALGSTARGGPCRRSG
eukprot:13430828-Alexandrium_andersonii.AAC.1